MMIMKRQRGNEADFTAISLTLLYESALMPAIKRGDARWGPACFAFIFTAVPVSTEVAFLFAGERLV